MKFLSFFCIFKGIFEWLSGQELGPGKDIQTDQRTHWEGAPIGPHRPINLPSESGGNESRGKQGRDLEIGFSDSAGVFSNAA